MFTCNPFPLKSYHTLAINNVSAKKIVVIKNIKELISIWTYCKKINSPFLILGEGSNTVFLENYIGIIIINRIKGIIITQNKKYWLIHVQSGEKWHNLVKYTLKHRFFGLENLALIPGCLGSAVIQNIGAFGLEIKDVCNYVDILSFYNFKITRKNVQSCRFQYRNSIFKKQIEKKIAIISVGLKLKKKWKPLVSYGTLKKLSTNNLSAFKIFQTICILRKKTLPNPKILGNSGSFFKNPIVNIKNFKKIQFSYRKIPHFSYNKKMVKLSAGWLIEQCGLNQFKIGGANIYKKKPLIIINENNATSNDIFKLAKKIYTIVKKKFNIHIQPEVQLITKIGPQDFSKIIL